ncbi:MAG: GNAT family protein [Ferruginibacter sp.]
MNFKFEDDIILENDTVLMRPISMNDIENLLSVATSDKTLLQYSPKQVYNRDLLTEYIETAVALRSARARYSFSIFDKRNICYVGSTAFMNISDLDGRLEIGATWIGKNFQGTGLNRQIKYLMLMYAFETMACNRVEFRTDERNMQSRRAIEKIGGKFEGFFRQHTLMYNGFLRNTACYSILKEEWMNMKQSFL